MGAMFRPLAWIVAVTCAACAAKRPEAAGPAPAPMPATVTDVADVPYVSELVSAPSGDRLAWVVNHRGRRNVWLASAPDYGPRPVTAFDRDDGQVISALTFSRDGSRLAFVRGGPENKGEAHPNAASDPRGTSRDVWTVATAAGGAVRIGAGASPTLSPDGAEVAFVHEDTNDVRNVWIAPAGGGTTRPIVQLQGNESELAWSPDGARIAFASDRGTYNLVGVYHRASESVTWMGPAAATSYDLEWSEDGTRLAFVRFPARQKPEPRVLEGVWFDRSPVSTIIADVATGDVHAVEATPDPFGGYTQWGQDRPVAWAGDRVVFASERDGWIRIYAAPAAGGGAAIALSPPGCESEIGDVARGGEVVFFTANCGDAERRHLWKAPVAGGPAVALTSGASLQWQPVVLDGGRTVAVIDAGATTPPWPALVSVDGGEPRRLGGAPALETTLVEPELVRIPLPGTDVVLTGQLFRPRGAAPARQAILYVHGGPVRQMLSGWHPMEFYHHSYVLAQRLAASGRIVLQLNYRLGTGYGRAFRLPAGAGPYGAAELADVLAARDYLAGLDGIEQVALWGASYGGFLTGLALGTASDRFAGGVSVCGVSSWSNRTSPHPDDAPLIAKWAPINNVDAWTAPVLLIHGDDDRNVTVQDSIDLAERLKARGRAEVELVLVPDEDHFFLRAASWELLTRRSIEFYDRLLAAAAPR
jgi:dipeptidyl aminopeptidase/acylaminoacyl peptidase